MDVRGHKQKLFWSLMLPFFLGGQSCTFFFAIFQLFPPHFWHFHSFWCKLKMWLKTGGLNTLILCKTVCRSIRLTNVDCTKSLSISSSLSWCVLTECSQFRPQRSTSGPGDPRRGTLWMKDDMEMFLPLAQQPAGSRERVATRQSFEATSPTKPHAQPQLHLFFTNLSVCSSVIMFGFTNLAEGL